MVLFKKLFYKSLISMKIQNYLLVNIFGINTVLDDV